VKIEPFNWRRKYTSTGVVIGRICAMLWRNIDFKVAQVIWHTYEITYVSGVSVAQFYVYFTFIKFLHWVRRNEQPRTQPEWWSRQHLLLSHEVLMEQKRTVEFNGYEKGLSHRLVSGHRKGVRTRV